jgi:sugar (pentulose or hexulose) kinase
VVLCGLHDSNAALLAARGYPEIGDRECTVLSTGTWFVAMRSVTEHTKVDLASLPESRDCLVNVDVKGVPVPSARFMGGREVELIELAASSPLDTKTQKELLLHTAETMVRNGAFVLPTFQSGVGPFPKSVGHWIERPTDQIGRRALAGLYLALVANVSLELIGSKGPVVIEGRFADDPVFTGALAAMQKQPVFLSDAQDSIAYGALRLIDPDLPVQAELTRAKPLEGAFAGYADCWMSMTQSAEAA